MLIVAFACFLALVIAWCVASSPHDGVVSAPPAKQPLTSGV